MVQGMLAVAVFCMFGFCFYIANKIDQFFDAIQETVKDKPERKQTGLKILFLNTLSDNELLKEVHESFFLCLFQHPFLQLLDLRQG